MDLSNRSNSLGSFAVLPDEIIIKIFGYVLAEDLLHLKATSKECRRLADDNLLWKILCEQFRLDEPVQSNIAVGSGSEDGLPPLSPYGRYFHRMMTNFHINWTRLVFHPTYYNICDNMDISSDGNNLAVVQQNQELRVYNIYTGLSESIYIPWSQPTTYTKVFISGSSVFLHSNIGFMVISINDSSLSLHGSCTFERLAHELAIPEKRLKITYHCTKDYVYFVQSSEILVSILTLKTCTMATQNMSVKMFRQSDSNYFYFYKDGILFKLKGKDEKRLSVAGKPVCARSNNDGVVAVCCQQPGESNDEFIVEVFFGSVLLWSSGPFHATHVFDIQVRTRTSVALIYCRAEDVDKKILLIEKSEGDKKFITYPFFPLEKCPFIPTPETPQGFVCSTNFGGCEFFYYSWIKFYLIPKKDVNCKILIYAGPDVIVRYHKVHHEILTVLFRHTVRMN